MCRAGLNKLQLGLPWWLICLQCGRPGFNPWVGKIPWRREWLPTPVFLPGEAHGQRNLAGYSLCVCKDLDTTEQLLLTHSEVLLSLLCISSQDLTGISAQPVQSTKSPRLGATLGSSLSFISIYHHTLCKISLDSIQFSPSLLSSSQSQAPSFFARTVQLSNYSSAHITVSI